MRKLLSTILLCYLSLIYAPLALATYDCGGGDTYEDAAEACYWCGAGCDDTTDEEVAAVRDAAEAEEGGEEVAAEQAEDRKRAIEAPMICPFGKSINYGSFDGDTLAGYYKDFYTTFEAGMNKSQCGDERNEDGSINEDATAACREELIGKCGVTVNSYSNYLEKGDCTAAGLVVTEITEVIAPDVTFDETDRVVTVYAGLCCLAGEVKSDGTVMTCDDTRTLYTTETSEGSGDGYTKCTAVAANCEKRQWVIGSSGIGIVKLMVKQIFTFGAFAVGSVAVGTLVFQGVKISVSGVSGDISDAKNKILQALAGIVLLFLSGLLLITINPDFFG